MKHIRIALLSMTLLLCLAATARAESRLEHIRKTQTLTLGYLETSFPFSYLDGDQPIGYALDICRAIAAAVGRELGLSRLVVQEIPGSASTRMALVVGGQADLFCSTDTHDAWRERQVAFTPTIFVAHTRFLALKSSGVRTLADLRGKRVLSTGGTTNVAWLQTLNASQNLGMRVGFAKNPEDALQRLEQGEAQAYFMDDSLLAGLVARSAQPARWFVSPQAFTVEPYGIMMPKFEPEFQRVVRAALVGMMRDGRLKKLYRRWFLEPIPPGGVVLGWPMSAVLERVLASPTDSADPKAYQ
ncbi:amino acid ABC transporter substrate-binding protein [Castellaniella caeni]|uniref:amino acid ABC transporter substrate-binding protein n=1 Tax=Castellaniella caeni TaxID=266123 RepID=UPI00082A4FC7|nr:amino acid ABC transporter substrate-binding protein [Castellaniella caeni]